MSPDEARAGVIAWSLERSRVRLAAAERELAAGVPQLAADHAYYACFHLVAAIFLQEGLSLKRHSALRAAVHERLIQTGRLDRRWGGIFDRLAELRTKSVYTALFDLDLATGRTVVADARNLAAELERLLGYSPTRVWPRTRLLRLLTSFVSGELRRRSAAADSAALGGRLATPARDRLPS